MTPTITGAPNSWRWSARVQDWNERHLPAFSAGADVRPRRIGECNFFPGFGSFHVARLNMPGSRKRRSVSDRRKVAAGEPYEVGYFAKKHDITRDQARELMRQIGNDRDKLNEAASRLFRK